MSRPVGDDELTGKSLAMYTDALMQLMNTYQRKGEPEECISVLQEIYEKSPILQNQCRLDFSLENFIENLLVDEHDSLS